MSRFRELAPEELASAYAPSPSRFLAVDGLRVHYRDEGRGPALLLLHGTASSLHTWRGWVERLADRFRVLSLDLPGFGLTGPDPGRDYRVARYVRFVAAFLDALEVRGPTHLAGNSLGGHIAASFAAAHPERVERLILLDAAGYPGSLHLPLGFRLARIPVLRRLVVRWTPRFLVRRTLRSAYGDPRGITPEQLDRHWHLLRARGNRQALVDRLALPLGAEPPDLGRIRAPALILWGEADRWIPPIWAERFHRDLAGSRLRIFPGVGHVPMEESPEPTAAAAASFLLGRDAGPPVPAAPFDPDR